MDSRHHYDATDPDYSTGYYYSPYYSNAALAGMRLILFVFALVLFVCCLQAAFVSQPYQMSYYTGRAEQNRRGYEEGKEEDDEAPQRILLPYRIERRSILVGGGDTYTEEEAAV